MYLHFLAAASSFTLFFRVALANINAGNGTMICGTSPNKEWLAAAEEHFQANKIEAVFDFNKAPIRIPVIFHVICANVTPAGGNIYQSQIESQIQVLNNAFSNSGFQWYLFNTTRTISAPWYYNIKQEVYTAEEREMKNALRSGFAYTLNIYSVGSISSGAFLGFAPYPSSYQADPVRDGIVILSSILPGGSYPPYDKGVTMVHEAGHWVGLMHTFDNGCSPGDSVDDTPAEAFAAFKCEPRDSCPGQLGFDPINNYMDYTDDYCRNSFTPGQLARARNQLATYRGIRF